MERRSDGVVLELERILPAPPAATFATFTDPDELAKWWGPEGFTIPMVDFRPRVGASYRIMMQPPVGDPFYLRGEFREVDPPGRLEFTFAWEQPDPDDVETLVELSFEPVGQTTRLSLRHGLFKTEARRALHRDGWRDSLDKLERIATEAPGAGG